jgi:hypothetical protein
MYFYSLYNPQFRLLLHGANVAQSLINDFKTRVANDSGNYEAESCQLAQLNFLNNIA